jgi:hypothetical protein
MSTRRGAAAAAASPVKRERRSTTAAAESKEAGDAFAFDLDGDAEMTHEEKKTPTTSGSKKKSTPGKKAPAASAKKSPTKRGGKKSAVDDEEEAEEAGESKMQDDASGELAAAPSQHLSRFNGSTGSTGSVSQLSSAEQSHLLNAETLKSVLGNKEQLAKTLRVSRQQQHDNDDTRTHMPRRDDSHVAARSFVHADLPSPVLVRVCRCFPHAVEARPAAVEYGSSSYHGYGTCTRRGAHRPTDHEAQEPGGQPQRRRSARQNTSRICRSWLGSWLTCIALCMCPLFRL